METINILHNKISFIDKGKGIPILFLPGIDGYSNVWINQVEELSLNHRIILLDLQELNINYISINKLVEIINEFIKFLNIDYFYICGYSLGALLSIAYANRYNENIAGVISTSLFNYNKSINELLKFYNITIKKNLLSKIIYNILKINIENTNIYKFSLLLKYNIIINELKKLQLPLIIINGEKDHKNSHLIAKTIYEIKNNCDFEIIENSNYNCFYTNFNEYNNLIEDFLIKNTK